MAQPKSASFASPAPEAGERPSESSPLLAPQLQHGSTQSNDDQNGQKSFARKWWRGGLLNYLCCIQRKKKAPSSPSAASMALKSPLQAVAATPLKGGWADGVFNSELLKQSIVPRNITAAGTGETISPPDNVAKPIPLSTGTYRGTKLALTQMTKRIETRYGDVNCRRRELLLTAIGSSPSSTLQALKPASP